MGGRELPRREFDLRSQAIVQVERLDEARAVMSSVPRRDVRDQVVGLTVRGVLLHLGIGSSAINQNPATAGTLPAGGDVRRAKRGECFRGHSIDAPALTST